MASTQDDGEKPKSKRLFLNHVDQFQGRNLAKVYITFLRSLQMPEMSEITDIFRIVDVYTFVTSFRGFQISFPFIFSFLL